MMLDLKRFEKLDVVIVAGLPGSGKSYFVNHFFKDRNRKRVNRRDIRKMLYEMTHFNDPWSEEHYSDENERLVRFVEKKVIGHLMEQQLPILIENTSVTADSRRAYIQAASLHHKRIGIIYLDVPLAKCVNRNQEREDAIPQNVIINLAASATQPGRSEGFEEVLILQDSAPAKTPASPNSNSPDID